MKSWALLSSNLPSVIDRSNLSPSREDTRLFIFIAILIMTQLHPRDQENRQQNRFSERRFSEKDTYNRLNGNCALSANNAQFVSVDLIGEKNQVILEFAI